jgi:hypothetical protein
MGRHVLWRRSIFVATGLNGTEDHPQKSGSWQSRVKEQQQVRWFLRIVFTTVAVASGFQGALAVGDFGPDTCVDGFVWREACGASDHVCVSPQAREQARLDNSQAANRRQPGGGPFGPDTCKQGFVWREACGPNDPGVRAQAADDNGRVAQRLKYPLCRRLAQNVETQKQLNFQYRCFFTGFTWQNSSEANFRLCVDGSSIDMQRVVDGQAANLQLCLYCKSAPPDDPRCVQFPH